MILTTAAGFAVQQLTGWSPALMVGVFTGLLTAPLVPKKGSCSLPRRAD
ncbi:MAG TPA: hypothetical protein VFT55_13730 [Planctomycetota bacterium]|nr:hypothetical protein [Planctomycetota bacterium]